jgi:acyl-CoA thioester hydrolase
MIQHTVKFRVRYAETDQMERYEFDRVELMRSIGLSYAESEKHGYRMPLTEAGLKYIKAAEFDQELSITASVNHKPGARIRYDYNIFSNNEIICEGFTIHGFMNTEGRAVKPPKEFLNKLKNYFN